MLRFGFEVMELTRIEAEVQAANGRSISLLKKLGFRREPVPPAESRDGPLRFHILPTG